MVSTMSEHEYYNCIRSSHLHRQYFTLLIRLGYSLYKVGRQRIEHKLSFHEHSGKKIALLPF